MFLFFPLLQAEEITLTTYYPSPSGVYNELDIHDRLGFRFDNSGITTELDLSIDADANLYLNDNDTSPSEEYHIIFSDVGKPFAYLKSYSSSSGSSWCADNYVAANFLKNDKTPANPYYLPSSGYIVCIRGWEE